MKNMVKTSAKTLVMAFLFGAAAAVRAGDIISIDVLEDFPYSTLNGGKHYPNPGNPHLIGETVSIRIRLVNDDLGEREKAYPWEFVSLSSGESTWLTAPRLGLSVGGVVRYATMVSCLPVRANSRGSEKYFTDVIFEYQVQPGDLAQPLRLLNTDMREAMEGDEYLIMLPSANSHFYNAVDASDPDDIQRDAKFSFCNTEVRSAVIGRYPLADSSADESGTPSPDGILDSAGVYIKTIDFDSDYVDTTTAGTDADPYIWRIIHQGSSTPTKNGNPSIVVDAAAIFEGSGYATMWVWTEDDDKLTPVGATQTFVVDGVERKALPVTISTGDTQKSFVIKATGVADDGAWVYMSSAPTNMYGTAGELVSKTVMRYIKIGEPMKPSVSVTFGGNSWTETTATDAYMEADYPVEMAITLSEPFTEDVTVTLTPVLKNGQSGSETNIDVYANHVIATAPAVGLGNGWQLATNSVTFTRNEDVEKFLYVYPLGATTGSVRNGGTGIEFQITVEPATAAAYFVTKTPGVLYVNAAEPNVVDPVANQAYAFTAGKARDIAIQVSDSCRNMRYLDGSGEVVYAGTNYYSVVWERNDDTSTSTMEWTGLVPDSDGNLTLKDVKYPNSGTYLASQITITGPEGKKVVIPVSAEVSLPRTVTATPDRADLTYAEGDTVKLTIGLSKRDGEDMYAFVEPLNEAATNCISGAQVIGANGKATGVGVLVPGTGTAGFKTLDITLLDGYCEPKFQVVLCSEETYDPAKIVDRYTPVPVTIVCENVAPQGKPGRSMRVGGYSVTNNAALPAAIPADNAVTLRIDIDDVAADRRLAVQPNETLIEWIGGNDPAVFSNGLFLVKWSFYNPNGMLVDTRITVGSAGTGYATTNFTFSSIGDNEVAVQMLDKDMIEALVNSGVERADIVSWSGDVPYGDENGYWESSLAEDDWGPEYRVVVPVADKANVSIAPVNATVDADGNYGFNEGQTSGSFDIVLSTPAERPLSVKLWLERTARTEGATLDLPTLGSFMLADTELAMDTNEYVTVDFKRGADRANVKISGMDGTPYSQYTLHAVVTTTTKNDNGVPLNEFYTEGAYDFGVFNYPDPKLKSIMANVGISYNPSTGLASTNAVSLTQNQEISIEWNVADNIRMDETNNFTVTWNSSEPGSTMTTNNAVRGTYKTKFSTAGEKTVTLSINDKDGGANFYEWHFTVEASKRLYVYPHGPNGDALSDQVASSYMVADGLGVGTAEADGALGDIVKFMQTWDYSVQANTAHVYARGLSAGEVDTNTIVLAERRGYPTQTGTLAASAGDAYVNSWSTIYDSFVYAFVQNTAGEGTVFTPSLKIKPQTGKDTAMQEDVVMPLAEKDAIAYPDRYVEVIFSREWLEADNCGDINADGVPDLFAIKVWRGGRLLSTAGDAATGGSIAIGSDLLDLADGNPDEDFIPGVWQAQGKLNLVNKELASYAPIGYPLNNRLEIRGFHHGLNETSLTLSDPSFSDAEQAAYKAAFKEKNNRDWTEADGFDLGFWSPEPYSGTHPRMDPTLADTDVDGMPDGWEYFFWYQAKVWAPAARNGGKGADLGKKRDGQLFVFERFNPNDIVRGIEIPAKEVLERFDPCVELDMTVDGFNPDFDGDGLTDLEELLIGTNPCHWDTDGDHMCDGWEVMHSLDPLNGSKVGNPDGDFMAYLSLRRYMAAEIPNADPNAPTTYVFDLGQELREYRDYETTDIEMYAMARYYDDEKKGPYIQTVNPKDANGDDNYPLYYYFDDDNNRRYTVDANDPDAGTNTIMRYTSQGAITIRDVPLASALVAPENLDANGRPYLYGLETDAPPIPIPAVWHWSYPMLDHKSPDFRRGAYVIPEGTLLTYTRHILIHDQVHAAFGFDPRTGWYKDSNGYVADRWNPQINSALAPTDSTGEAINTDPYTDYDEYLVMRYRHDFGIRYYDDGKYDPNDIWATFANYTTKPNVVYAKTDIEAILNPTNDTESATSYDSETAANLTSTANISEYLANAFAEAGSTKSPVKGHGADTDGDGVPDGWELYKGRNPNAAPSRPTAVGNEGLGEPWDKEELDGTPDGLGWTAEYAGTDSCNAYKDCPSIYNNHPGLHPAGEGFQQGWFNKFFPTDPDNPDTDGDGILDGYEGMAWRGTWYNGGVAYVVAPTKAGMTFIYGDPQDSITCCVRGGGMNPCTVDTDIDGLPDPWEMQYAGIPVDALSRKYVGPAPDFDPDIAEATFTSDGLNAADFALASNVVYICGGMDATWGGDGFTDPLMNGNSTDALLGTVRDVDFDHDGLQNYQEYLVQQVRHFRYDDITTPLMGRYMDEGEYDLMNPMGPLLSNHVINEAPAFTPMMQDADQFVFTAIENWGDGAVVSIVTNAIDSTVTINEFTGAEMTNFVYEVITNVVPGNTVIARKYYGDGYNYMYSTPWVAAGWRKNGYMASPIHYWDRMITCAVIQPSIMMPPAGVYVSTDPRLADTDGDGMDDYYEMFHGLNPLLGSTEAGVKDIIALAWGQPAFYNAFWNEWTHPDFNRIVALMGMPGSIADPTPLQAAAALDPFRYPWSMGAGEADPDGDGLRNDSERVTANLTSPMTTHTDPTPLWFTDTSSPASYTAQYYQNTTPVNAMPFWPTLIGFDDPYSAQTPDGGYGGFQFLYSFEENEGYDTDNDWKGDGREIVRTFRAPTDPLDFTDPARRQALYLDGDRSWVQSRATFMRDIFTGKVPSSTTVDFFKQFTAEAWIRPEKVGEQVILDRCSLYGYDAINKDEAAIRTNFRIGLTDEGKVYGMFDNDDAKVSVRADSESCQTVIGPVVPVDEWTHVAMTYDGKRLVLYVNGAAKTSAPTQLIPANGVTAIIQDPTYTNAFTQISYEAVPGAFFIGGRPLPAGDGGAAAFNMGSITYDAMNDGEWFQGYIDEVRIWDGARTETEIAANYRRHMTMDDAATNRLEVYTHLMGPEADSSRNDNDGLKNLTAELVQLYDFSTLPGSLNKDDVALNPSGFDRAVRGQLVSRPAAFSENLGWWDACATKSKVYTDYGVMPWIENTVHHLPVMDGSVVDSFIFSDMLGGYVTTAEQHELQKYALKNSAMPYPFYNYFLERYQRLFKLNQIAATDPENLAFEDLVCRYEFEVRSDFIGTADLVPMGGAYSKPCPVMWDGQGSSDLWEQTGSDTDGDGLPDWWEDVNGLDKNDPSDWASTITWNNADMPAWEAYLRDLARGAQPDGSVDGTYASTSDIDGDGLLDWWQNIYAVEQGAGGDDDGDGLGNYVEYMLSEVFNLKSDGKWVRFAPDNAYSVTPNVSDYFFRIKELYVGEIFTDHDQIKDQWESEHLVDNDNVSAYAFDPDIDADADGWTNYAEFQAGTKPTVLASLSVDAIQMNEYPVPTLELTVSYHGKQNVADIPVVAKAWHNQSRVGIPDAVWTLGGEGDVRLYENGNSNIVTGVKYFGMNPMREMLIHLSPGSVVPGSIKFEFKDLAWILFNIQTLQSYVSDPVTAIWEGPIIDQPRNDDLSTGDIVRQGYPDESFGTIDYATGELKVNFAAFPDWFAIDGDISQTMQGAGWISVYNLQKSYVRVNWQSKLITGGSVNTYYLSEADARSTDNNSLGHVKQGLNTIEAFYDLDGNGMYTPGEPYGFVRDVDIGWNYGKATIELTDTTTVAPRYNLVKGTVSSAGDETQPAATEEGGSDEATDRETLWKVAGTADVYTLDKGEVPNAAVAPESDNVRVRIVRYAVDNPTNRLNHTYAATLYDRVLDLTADGHQVLTEADILSDERNAFDLDWDASAAGMTQQATFTQMRGAGSAVYSFTNVYYGVYIGNGETQPSDSTNSAPLLVKLLVRKFFKDRAVPIPVPGPTVINSPAPTFSWRTGVDATYTAFRIRVTGSGFSWTSDYQLMPPHDADGVCSWTPPLRVGAIMPGGTAEFKNGGTYTWSISTYNAKFKTDSWVEGGTFLANVLTNSTDYATARVAVRYYGPSAVASSGKIRVQAFKTPDFSGEPVAEGYVKSTASLASTDAIKSENALIVGLKPGSYYIRAFIDTENDGKRSFWVDTAARRFYWESWGCYCTRDLKLGTIFTPKSITVGPGYGTNEIIPVFIEDCDTDRDSLPDAWEWAKKGNLTAYGAASIDQNAGGFAMKKELSGSIETKGALSSGLAVMTMTNLKSPRIAALLLGVDATGTDAQVNSALNNAKSDATAEPTAVAITAIDLDRDTGKVSITTETVGKESGSVAATSDIYEFASGSGTLTLTCKIWHRDSLESGDWKVIKTQKVEIGKETKTYEFDLASDVDLSSGFFKATLDK